MISCGPCAVGYHEECYHPDENGNCHCSNESTSVHIGLDKDGNVEVKERGGQIKEASKITDLESTGRKRAARLYPIPKNGQPGFPMACEWAGLKSAGGGIVPIVGCSSGLAENIHHGPDKNTVSNFVGNVHRICSTCHNRWHTLNDGFYLGKRPNGDEKYLPLPDAGESREHDPFTKATPDDFMNNELMWVGRKLKLNLDEIVVNES